MELTLQIENVREWVPIRLYHDGDRRLVDWCHVGSGRFTRPFFEDTVSELLRRPFNLLFRHQTPIEFLGQVLDSAPGVKPTGFIFHTSRCGSTLVSQMLAAVERNIVLSEPPPIDSVLRADVKGCLESAEKRARWLVWMVSALAQKRNPAEENLFIKFDSWSTLAMDVIVDAFPGVPWVFVYRNPVEVLVSQMDQRGVHMMPGVIPGLLPDIGPDELMHMRHEEYCARVLERVCRAALQRARDANGMFLNYSELPDAVTGPLVKHFRAEYSPEELRRMRSVSAYNAKSPRLDFESDTERKRMAASVEVRAAAAHWVEAAYAELEDRSSRTTGE